MSLFRMVRPKNSSSYLSATGTIDAAKAVAAQIPGVRIEDEGATYTGPWHALLACWEAGGSSVDWEGAASDYIDPHEPSLMCLPEYQKRGMRFIRKNFESGALLADDVGVGKTVQTIAALAHRKETVIVLCPASLRGQWAGEIKRWTKELTGEEQVVHVVYPDGDKRSKTAPPPDPKWIVAFYLDAMKAEARVNRKRAYTLVIDEAHNIRNWKSGRRNEINRLGSFAAGRLALTASWFVNDMSRLYSLLDLIQPWAWGKRDEFLTRYASGRHTGYTVEAGALSHMSELRNRMSLMALRRVREDIATELPFSTKYQMVWLTVEASSRFDAARSLNAIVESHGDRAKAASHLEHVALTCKVHPVAEAVASDLDAGRPALVLTWLRAHAEALHKALPGSLLVMGGKGDSADRVAGIQSYVRQAQAAGKVPCVVGTLAAIGEGGNLQALKSVHIAAIPSEAEQIRQAVGRVARMGQSGEVPVRIYGVRGTLDERDCGRVLKQLREAVQVDGRVEVSKGDLKEALDPSMTADLARELYERMLAEEVMP